MTRSPDAFRQEAASVRDESRRIKAAMDAAPGDAALQNRYAELKRRYEALAAEFRQAEARQAAAPQLAESPAAAMFDPAQFDIALDRPASKPVVINTEDTLADKALALLTTAAFWRHSIALALLVLTGFVFFLIMRGDVGFYQVPTKSMVPTFQPGDNIIAAKSSSYARGEIIVIPDPGDPEAFVTKRIVAKAGDTVEVRERTLYVNGQPIAEPYLREPMDYSLRPTQVGPGEVFLLGDNRNESADSYIWGRGLAEKDIKGRVFYIYRPSSRRGTITDHTAAFAGL